jgi:N-methylhydantoinase A
MKTDHARYRIGIDVGGTFTDFVVIDVAKGEIKIGKTLTTSKDPTLAIMKGLSSLMGDDDLSLGLVQDLVYGTTLVTNTIIERKGAKTGLITTMGYRDTLEIGNETRYDLYDLFLERPKPLVMRYLRREVDERVSPDGRVLVRLNEDSVKSIAEDFDNEGIQVVAVCLIHSYANPEHEMTIKDILEKAAPQMEVVLSSRVAPEIREYERTSTTALNAYVRLVIANHLRTMEEQLRRKAFKGPFYVMLSGGGITSARVAQEFPIRLIESGPAAGALAASHYSHLLKEENLISFDMGGTTAKICLIEGGQPAHSTSFETDRVHRFKKGSGLPVKVPVIEMIEIGAGGGSIAHIDSMRLLKVGPTSSGSDPGPACYGFGGENPTVTDADLVLGLINAQYFLGGELKLDKGASEHAIEKYVAIPLSLSLLRAAVGIYEVVSENMASAAKVYISEKGRDPRRYALVAFGGAGPVHAYRVAQLLKIKKIICPFAAGTASAFGLLTSPLAFDFVKSYVARLDQLDWSRAETIFKDMEASGQKMLLESGIHPSRIAFTRSAEMRYVGQGHEISVPMPMGGFHEIGFGEKVRDLFYQSYEKYFGRCLSDVPIEVINWRVVVSGPRPEVNIKGFMEIMAMRKFDSPKKAIKEMRRVYFSEVGGFYDTPIYDRYQLNTGIHIRGPAVVEERDSTIVAGPEATIYVDDYYNLIIELSYKS